MRKKRLCLECGKELPSYKERRQRYCYDCAAQRMRASWQQLWDKEGPFYDRWKEGVQRHAASLE